MYCCKLRLCTSSIAFSGPDSGNGTRPPCIITKWQLCGMGQHLYEVFFHRISRAQGRSYDLHTEYKDNSAELCTLSFPSPLPAPIPSELPNPTHRGGAALGALRDNRTGVRDIFPAAQHAPASSSGQVGIWRQQKGIISYSLHLKGWVRRVESQYIIASGRRRGAQYAGGTRPTLLVHLRSIALSSEDEMFRILLHDTGVSIIQFCSGSTPPLAVLALNIQCRTNKQASIKSRISDSQWEYVRGHLAYV
jgi:hypothetical protein